jgi:hypothetical protein
MGETSDEIEPSEGLRSIAYKALADSAEKTADRRLESNNVYLAINGAVAGLDTFLIEQKASPSLLTITTIFGALACFLWIVTLLYYRDLGRAKYDLLGQFEKEHGIIGYSHEWVVFQKHNLLSRWGFSLSALEISIAGAVLIGHIVIYATFGLQPGTFHAGK